MIPRGGHNCSIPIEGIKDWKYAQKNDTESKTSEIINNIIPIHITPTRIPIQK